MQMPLLIAENTQTTIAAGLTVVLTLIAFAATDEQLRKDAAGAARRFFFSIVAQLVLDYLSKNALAPKTHIYLQVLVPLLFGFGVIRTSVGFIIWLFRSRRGIPTPKIVRDVVDGVLYAVCLALVLRATTTIDLASIVATSAALSVVVGLALQETLGNVFAGLSLQLEHPFHVGDWVAVNEFVGRVVQVAWRGTKLETLRREQVTVPNASIAKANVVNFSRHKQVARDLTIGVSYKNPPNLVKGVLMEVLAERPEVVKSPAPSVRVLRFDDSAITYQLRFFVEGFEAAEQVTDVVLSAVWYRFKREEIEIPFPTRTLQVERLPPVKNVLAGADAVADTLQLLATVDFLKPLGADGRAELSQRVSRELFGAGETIIRAGEAGDSFYIVAEGRVAIRAVLAGKEQEVAKLGRGDFFGEMSLLTGEPRTATVVAASDATLVTMSRAAFAQALSHHTSVAQELADILGKRRADLDRARAGADAAMNAKAESSRIFGRLRELFKVAG